MKIEITDEQLTAAHNVINNSLWDENIELGTVEEVVVAFAESLTLAQIKQLAKDYNNRVVDSLPSLVVN